MGQKMMLVLVAGAALSVTGSALADHSGFTIADQTGDNSLTVGGGALIEYSASFRDSDVVGDTEDFTQGYGNPYTTVDLTGHVGGKQFTYRVQLTHMQDEGGDSGAFSTENVYGEWDFQNGWAFRWGQFNAPFVREVSMGSLSHLGTGISQTAQYFGQGYSQGIMAIYGDEQMRFMGSWTDGFFTADTHFASESADFGLTARAEGIVSGAGFDQFDSRSSWMSTTGDNVLVGGAVHYEDGGETGGTTDYNALAATIDAMWHGPGYAVNGAFFFADVEIGGGGGDRTDMGVNVEGAFFFNETLEGFARVDWFLLDDDAVGAADDSVGFITVGVNCYPFPENNCLRFTGQLGYALNDTSGLAGGLGSFPSDNGFLGQSTDGEIAAEFGGRFIF